MPWLPRHEKCHRYIIVTLVYFYINNINLKLHSRFLPCFTQRKSEKNKKKVILKYVCHLNVTLILFIRLKCIFDNLCPDRNAMKT